MKRIGCKGFENHPCYNGIDDSEFSKALDEGKELTGWSCDGKEYYKLTVSKESKVPLIIDGTKRECPRKTEEKKIFKPYPFKKRK